MQQKSEEKCSDGVRLDTIRIRLQINWADVAQRLGLSESMIYQVKSGKKRLSPKAIYRLEKLEEEAGVGSPFDRHLQNIQSASAIRESDETADAFVLWLGDLEQTFRAVQNAHAEMAATLRKLDRLLSHQPGRPSAPHAI